MNCLLADFSTASIANMIDIAIIALLVIFVIAGLIKGFMNTLFKFIGSIGSVFVGILTAKPVLGFINSHLINLNALFGKMVQSNFEGIEGVKEFIVDIGKEQLIENIRNGVSTNKFLQNILINIIKSYNGAGDVTGLDLIAGNIGGIIATIVVAIGVALVMSVVVRILLHVFHRHEDENGGKFVTDRILGGLFGAVKCIVFVAFAVSILALVGRIVKPVNETLEQTKIARIPYEIVENKIDQAEEKIVNWALKQVGIDISDDESPATEEGPTTENIETEEE